MITYNFTNTGSDSLYEYLYKCIKNDILQGNIRPGEKLPSKRSFAKNLGISVITVENAYEQLIAEGYIYSMPKRGFYVTDFKKAIEIEKKSITKEIVSLTGGDSGYLADFSSNQTQYELFPFTIWTKMVREVLNENQMQLMTNPPCGGILFLREAIATYLKEFRGMTVLPEQIIVGAGTEYLYGLLIQLFGKDKIYAVENPGYRKIPQIYKSWQVPCEYINMDSDGVKVSELEEKKADIVHISPSHHYPTGIVMPISRRYELLGWASKNENHYIIEDDYDSELRLSGQPIHGPYQLHGPARAASGRILQKTLLLLLYCFQLRTIHPGKIYSGRLFRETYQQTEKLLSLQTRYPDHCHPQQPLKRVRHHLRRRSRCPFPHGDQHLPTGRNPDPVRTHPGNPPLPPLSLLPHPPGGPGQRIHYELFLY